MPKRSQTVITDRLVKSAKSKDKPYDVRDRDLKGFMLRVTPAGSKTYYCSWARGKRSRIGDAKLMTLTRAREIAEQRIAGAKRGEVPKPEIRAKVETLRSFVEDRYTEWAKQEQKQGESNAKRITGAFHDLADKPLDRITAWLIDKWKAQRLADGTSPATVNRDLAQLKAAMNKAAEWGLIEENPVTGVKRAKGGRESRVRYLSPQEVKRLMSALDKRESRIRTERASGNAWRRERGYTEFPEISGGKFADHLKPLVQLSINTGLRWGEASSLTWDNTRLGKTPTLTVEAAHAKSGKTRHIPLNAKAVEVLKKWKEQSKSSGYVFPGEGGGRLVSVRKSWGKLLKDAKITDFRWHDLRHHFASQLVMKGVDLNTVRELLGHGSIDMTLVYAHLAPEHKAAAVALLDG